MNPVRKIVDDTKDRNTRWEEEMAVVKLGISVESPDEFMAKLHQQATDLGPVMEEMLRASEEHGHSQWGLNE